MASAMTDKSMPAIDCPICMETLRNPKALHCGHIFCAECIEKLVFGGSVTCPTCRVLTAIPLGGLPTLYLVQEFILHYQNNDEQKRYRCAECDRQCTADEAWISNTNADEDVAPRCSRCVITKHAGTGSALPAAMESVTDAFKHLDDDLSKLTTRVERVSNLQRVWTTDVRKAAWNLQTRVDDIGQATRAFVGTTLNDVDKVNNEFDLLSRRMRSVNVPQSLEGLGPFKQSVQDAASKLDQLARARSRTITGVNLVLDSLAAGLDCVLTMDCYSDGNIEVGVSNCQKCGEEGHVAADCPQSTSQSRQIICYSCGEEGHIARICSKKSGQANGTRIETGFNGAASTSGLSFVWHSSDANDQNVQGGDVFDVFGNACGPLGGVGRGKRFNRYGAGAK